jgi:hypothetical protein
MLILPIAFQICHLSTARLGLLTILPGVIWLIVVHYSVNIPNLIPSFFNERQANRELVLVRQWYETRAGSWIS